MLTPDALDHHQLATIRERAQTQHRAEQYRHGEDIERVGRERENHYQDRVGEAKAADADVIELGGEIDETDQRQQHQHHDQRRTSDGAEQIAVQQCHVSAPERRQVHARCWAASIPNASTNGSRCTHQIPSQPGTTPRSSRLRPTPSRLL